MFLIGTLLNFLCIIGALVYSKIPFQELLDFPAMMIIFFPVFFTGFLSNTSEFGNAFRNLFIEKDFSKKQRTSHGNIFEIMGKVAYGVGWISFIINLLSSLTELSSTENPIGLFKIISKSSIPVFYGLFLYYIFFLPAAMKVRNSLK